jgi:hypothetical protein
MRPASSPWFAVTSSVDTSVIGSTTSMFRRRVISPSAFTNPSLSLAGSG